MSVSLSAMVSRLSSLVPARDSVPSLAQYQQAVEDAVADLSARAPMQKVTTLSVVSGTAAYDLPSDFLRVIDVQSLLNPSGVIITSGGIVPVSADYTERWMVAGRTITFYPTPTYTVARDVWYAAGHVLGATGAYASLTGEDATTALLEAQSLALMIKANKAADDAWSYSIGDERVSKEKLAAELRAQANELHEKYVARAAKAGSGGGGAYGTRAIYDATGH
jgi:hypothetical protein